MSSHPGNGDNRANLRINLLLAIAIVILLIVIFLLGRAFGFTDSQLQFLFLLVGTAIVALFVIQKLTRK